MKNLKIEEKNIILEIKKALEAGGVVVLPTDTVYGLMADATNSRAVKKIFAIKNRPLNKPISVFVKEIAMAKQLARISREEEKTLDKYWPGETTFIFKIRKHSCRAELNSVCREALAGGETIGIRIPNYELFFQLFKQIDFPLVQTSANVSDNPAPLSAAEAAAQFKDRTLKPDLIVDAGYLGKNKASTVIDLTREGPAILRQGETKLP